MPCPLLSPPCERQDNATPEQGDKSASRECGDRCPMPVLAAKRSARPAPVAPPATAIELPLAASAFLEFLSELEDPGMVVRGGGLTLFQKMPFGVFVRETEAGPSFLRDTASGLSVDPSKLRRICLLHGGGLPPSFEIECDGAGFALAVWPGISDLATVCKLVSDVGGRPLPYEAVRCEGAAAWLDEIGPEEVRGWHNRLVFDRDAETVFLSIRSSALAIAARFRPALVDRDGPTLRLSDEAGRHVLHFRAGADAVPFPSLSTPHHSRP